MVNTIKPLFNWLSFALIFILIFLGALFNDSWLIFRAAYFLALGGLFSFLWIRLNNVGGVKAYFKTTTSPLQAGESIDLKLSVENPSPLPRVWLETSLQSSIPGMNFHKVISLRGYDSKKWSFPSPSLRRGLYTLGPISVSTRDPFCFQGQRQEYNETSEILVYPRTEDLPFFDPYLDNKQASHLSRIPWSFFSYQAGGIRSYVHGDSLRRVHWPSTAKVGKLMVKVLDSTSSHQVWLLLDMQEDVHSADGESEEYLVSAAASVAKKLLEAGLDVGLLYYSEERYFLAAGVGRDHLGHILRALALARARGKVPIAQVIQREMPLLMEGASIVLFSTTPELELLYTLEELKSKGCNLRVVLEDLASFGGKGSALPLVTRLQYQGIRAYQVAAGEPLAEALNDRKLELFNKIPAGAT